jgi:cyclin-dependent kinase
MTFPQWKVEGNSNLKKLCSNMDERGIDLLQKMVELEPSKRISAKEALDHPYFEDYREADYL